MKDTIQPGAFLAWCREVYPEPETCEWCGYTIDDDDRIDTGKGVMHESCAKKRAFRTDNGDSVWPR